MVGTSIALAVWLASSAGTSHGPVTSPLSKAEVHEIAARASWSFCHDSGRIGCDLSPMFMHGEWVVIAEPLFPGKRGEILCCAVDAQRVFIFTAAGKFIREEPGGP